MSKGKNHYILLEVSYNDEILLKLDLLLKKMLKSDDFKISSIKNQSDVILLNLFSLKSYITFIASFDALLIDFNDIKKGLIVPCFDLSFISLFSNVDDKKLMNIYSLISENKVDSSYLLLLDDIYSNFDGEVLKIIKVYIENNCSPELASISYYAHKNTITNNINKFINDSDIDLEYFYNRIYILSSIDYYLKNKVESGENYD